MTENVHSLYSRLGPGGFRYLSIQSAERFDDDLHGSLVVSTLEPPPSYEALSYVWGTSKDQFHLYLDGQPFIITENLNSGLRHLRSKHKSRALWVDAVCINQQDLKEKSELVKNMHVVYQKATRVIVWLGPQGDDSALAYRLIRNAAAVKRKEPAAEPDRAFASGFSRLDLSAPSPGTTEKFAYHLRSWRSLAALFGRPWWHRVWVIQEAVFAEACHVVCGQDSIDFNEFVEGWPFVFNACGNVSPAFAPGILRGRVTQQIAFFKSLMKVGPLEELVYRLGGHHIQDETMDHLIGIIKFIGFQEATDPRDHIYGVLNIAYPDRDKVPVLPITVDYQNRDAAQVFTDATIHIIENTQELRILSQVEQTKFDSNDKALPLVTGFSSSDTASVRFGEDGKWRMATSPDQMSPEGDASLLARIDSYKRVLIPKLPSWVPNWAQPQICAPLFGDYMPEVNGKREHGYKPYNASKDLEADWTYIENKEDGRIFELRTKAILVDDVVWISKDYYGGVDFIEALTEIRDLFHSASGVLVRRGESKGEAFYRTMAIDRDAHGHPLPASIDYDSVVLEKLPDSLSNAISRAGVGRSFAIFGKGFIGLVPRATAVGDTCAIIPGCHVPMILRFQTLIARKEIACSAHNDKEKCREHQCLKTEDVEFDRWQTVIGSAYVHGIMDGGFKGKLETLNLR